MHFFKLLQYIYRRTSFLLEHLGTMYIVLLNTQITLVGNYTCYTINYDCIANHWDDLYEFHEKSRSLRLNQVCFCRYGLNYFTE